MDQNGHDLISLPPAALDNAALVAAQKAIEKADPEASVLLLELSSAQLQDDRSHLLKDGKYSPSVELSATLKREAATHLLLVTKRRAEASLQLAHGPTGSGTLEGLGYYIDRQLPVRSQDTHETTIGFLAPYAYFTVSCIDLATSQILKQRDVTATNTIAAGPSESPVDPWAILNPQQKLETLRIMISREIAAVVPEVLQQEVAVPGGN